jgi:hypothetical protein
MLDSKDGQINKIKPYGVLCLSFSRKRQLSRDVLSDAGFLFHKVSVFREVIGNRIYGFVSVINYTVRRYIQEHFYENMSCLNYVLRNVTYFLTLLA